MLIDLNARRSAEAAKHHEPRTLRVGEREFALTDEMSLVVVHALGEGDLVGAAKGILADPDADFDEFVKLVTIGDLGYIVSQWGTTLGESSGSTTPFPDTGEPSTPTSPVATEPISPTVATESVPGQ